MEQIVTCLISSSPGIRNQSCEGFYAITIPNDSLIHKMANIACPHLAADNIIKWGNSLDFPLLDDTIDHTVDRIVLASIIASTLSSDRLGDCIALCSRYTRNTMKLGLKTWLIIIRRTLASLYMPWPRILDDDSTTSSALTEWANQNEGETETSTMLLIHLIRKFKCKNTIQTAIEYLDSVIY
jgi:hypothetical protein